MAPALYKEAKEWDTGPQGFETYSSIALASAECILFSLLKHLYDFDSYVTVSTLASVAVAQAASHIVAVHPS